jgi:hypothetical protein
MSYVTDKYGTRALNLSVPDIKERRAYEVKGRLFKTPNAAAKKLAWHFILSKYGDTQKVTRVLGMECDCYEEDMHPCGLPMDTPYTDSTCCLLHERQYGYFKRLHTRLTKRILAKWAVIH